MTLQTDITYDFVGLNEQQQDMLRLFKQPMPQNEYNEIKRFIVKKIACSIDKEMEQLAKEKSWTQETYEQWGKEHLRTPYKK